jgi:hypothetical protein
MSKDLKAELAQSLMDMDVNVFRMAPVKVCVFQVTLFILIQFWKDS